MNTMKKHFEGTLRDKEGIPCNKRGQRLPLNYCRLPDAQPSFNHDCTNHCQPLPVNSLDDYYRLFLPHYLRDQSFSADSADTSSLLNIVLKLCNFETVTPFNEATFKTTIEILQRNRNDWAHEVSWSREKFLEAVNNIESLAKALQDENLVEIITKMRKSEPTNCNY